MLIRNLHESDNRAVCTMLTITNVIRSAMFAYLAV